MQEQDNGRAHSKIKVHKKQGSCIDCFFSSKRYFFITNQRAKNVSRVLALIFLLLAVGTYFLSDKINKITIPYSVKRNCLKSDGSMKFQNTCNVGFQINQTIKAPIYVLYSLSNIYINHKKYLKSVSKEQLYGKTISQQQAIEQCTPIIYNRDLPWNKSWGGYPLNPDDIASPCGLKAMLFFNDSYKIKSESGKEININQNQIVRQESDYRPQPQSQKFQWINPTDEHFQVYMQDRSLMTKKRLWGIIQQDLPKGNYTLIANNSYQLNSQPIRKSLELSNSSILGNINYFFPIAFAACAILCIAYSILLSMKFDNVEEFIADSIKQSYRL